MTRRELANKASRDDERDESSAGQSSASASKADPSNAGESKAGQSIATELERLRPGLASWLSRRGAPSDRLADLVQDAITKAWRARDEREPGRPIGPWLARIGERVWLDDLRARERRGRHEAFAAKGRIVSGRGSSGPADVISDEVSDNPADRAAVRETIRRLHDELERMPRRTRDVFHRFYRSEQSVAQIADALGIPRGTVKSDLHRARRILAAHLTEDEGDTSR